MRNRCCGVLALVVMVVAIGCSGDDDASDDAVDDGSAVPSTAPEANGPDDASASGGSGPDTATDDVVSSMLDGSTSSPSSAPLETLPPIGVPGLDSDDLFCRSWSRFGGSFQVVAVAAAFAPGEPVDVYALEVVAAPVVDAAFDELLANWPAELESERDDVAERFLGPYARRAELALERFVAAGATDEQVETVQAAWLDALARRDPDEVDVTVDLPDGVWAVVDVAAADLDGRIEPIPTDPSLVTDVEVPLTEAYIATNCPDRGTLGGGDVEP
jgi:hypothetical protein